MAPMGDHQLKIGFVEFKTGTWIPTLHCIALCRDSRGFFFVFDKLKAPDYPTSSKHPFSYSTCSPHVSVQHFGNSLNISNFLIIYLL